MPIPTELWIKIIRELPSHYQRTCLSVSKLFHDISLQFVFARINVRLGLLTDAYLAHEQFWNEKDTPAGVSTTSRSGELLQYIVRSPNSDLAQAVKHVSVRAYSLLGESPPSELIAALEEALSFLRLRGFAWYGCHPVPRRPVFEALSTASHETLEDMVLPAELADPIPIEKFSRLQSLSFLNRYAACYEPVEAEHSRFISIRQTTATTSIPLFSLGTFCEALWKSDLQRLSTLTELTLALITDVPDPISGVLRHFPLLRSLTVLVGDDYAGDVFTVLRAHPNALPRLAAFRLSHPSMDTETEVEAVATFLQKKTLLERLELGHHWSSCAFGDLEPVLEILPELPRLRVLGLELGDSGDMDPTLTPDHLLRLGRCIPPGLTALSLWVAATTQPELTEDDWIHFFSGLCSCRFIYVGTDHEYLGARVLQAALLDHPPPLAELVGFNHDLAWVERERDTGRLGYSEPWPLSKVYYRTAEEFGCEEWEWLLRNVDMKLM